ncbi:MAG: tyrosine-type recombinase/integrase [Magnetococcales bacterium]|nr:tyrosine-type recombinase/integrase [Magnetococcales bacterium]
MSGLQESFSGETLLKAALVRYLEQISVHKSPTQHARERRKAGQIAARLGESPLGEITALDVSGYRDTRLREASAAIVQGDLDLLRELFEVAVARWGVVLDGNPVGGVAPTRAVLDRERAFKPGELARLLAACDRRPTPMLGWIVRIALQTGMSKEEILRLRIADVDLEARMVTIPRVLSRPMRQVPLTRVLVGVFREVLNYPERPEGETLLFFGAMGSLGIRRPLAIDKGFRAAVVQARLKGCTFGDLRHEAVTRLAEAGLSEVEVHAVAGMPMPRGVRVVKPTVGALVARLDEVGFGVEVGATARRGAGRRENRSF